MLILVNIFAFTGITNLIIFFCTDIMKLKTIMKMKYIGCFRLLFSLVYYCV